MKCKMKTFDIKTLKGECSADCKYGAWNGCACGAEHLMCGGDLYLTEDGKAYCTNCGEILGLWKVLHGVLTKIST